MVCARCSLLRSLSYSFLHKQTQTHPTRPCPRPHTRTWHIWAGAPLVNRNESLPESLIFLSGSERGSAEGHQAQGVSKVKDARSFDPVTDRCQVLVAVHYCYCAKRSFLPLSLDNRTGVLHRRRLFSRPCFSRTHASNSSLSITKPMHTSP